MKSLTFFKWAAGLLLVMNLGLLAFMFFRPGPPHGDRKHPTKERLQKELGFDEKQFQEFHESVEVHKEKMELANEEQSLLL